MLDKTRKSELKGATSLTDETSRKYGPKGERPSGRILVHNHISRTPYMTHGLNGFRYWYDWPPGSGKKSRHFNTDIVGGKFVRAPQELPNYVVCKCGWRPDLGMHYRIRGMGSADYRCETAESFAKMMKKMTGFDMSINN